MIKRPILKILCNAPKEFWASSQEERKCLALAKQQILKASGSIKYRKKLLESLIEFHRKDSANDEAQNAMGEDL